MVPLHQFQAGTDGAYPTSLIRSNWKLYGTTTSGGGSTVCPYGGCGTVFQMTPASGGARSQRVLYAFRGAADGGSPNSLVEMNGSLYGMTGCYTNTVFQLSPSASETGGWNSSLFTPLRALPRAFRLL